MKSTRGVVWVLFDLANGDEYTKRYLWYFDTREAAREHRRRQHGMKHGARLSQPEKWTSTRGPALRSLR